MYCEGYWLPTPFANFPFTFPPSVTVCHYISNGVYHKVCSKNIKRFKITGRYANEFHLFWRWRQCLILRIQHTSASLQGDSYQMAIIFLVEKFLTKCYGTTKILMLLCLSYKLVYLLILIMCQDNDSQRAGRSGYRIPVGPRFSAPVQTGLWPHPATYTIGTGSFPGVKQPKRGVGHPPPFSAEVKERVGLYLYSPFGSSWPILEWTLPFTFTFTLFILILCSGIKKLWSSSWRNSACEISVFCRGAVTPAVIQCCAHCYVP